MTDTPDHVPTRRGKPRARRPSDPRRRRIDLRRHRRRVTGRVITADVALFELMRDGDVYQVGGQRYLVAPISADLLERLMIAANTTEDHEPNGDDEPSVGHDEDRESDGIDDERFGGDAALGWANEGSQEHLHAAIGGEGEPDLGWANTGSQLDLAAGYERGSIRESDGDCDAEDDDPGGDVLDRGEFDPCDLGEPDHDDDGVDADGGTGFMAAG
jgi:hypothetical protein